MLPKPKECSKCIIGHHKNSGFIQPEGTCKNGVLIIGEAPGENEKNDALPFRPYAESGSALQACINLLKKYDYKWERGDFAYWNLIACQPSFNKLEGAKFEEEAILTCRANYFNQVIAYYKPKVILGLGNLTVKYLVPEIDAIRTSIKGRIQDAKIAKNKEEIKKLQSQLSKLKIGNIRGYKFQSLYGIPLVPSFHPSYITRGGRELLGVLLRDMMFALEIAEGKWQEDYKFENYIENPEIQDIKKFHLYCKNHPKLPISYDIETPFTTLQVDETEIEFGQQIRDIESIQFSIPVANSLSNGNIRTRSIFLDWQRDIESIREILELPNPKVGWNNWNFDETNLQYHLGKDALKGIRYDAMWLFKHLNADFKKTGRALQFAANFYIPNLPAWKHLSEEEPRKYGLIDVDATLKTYLALRKQLEGAKSPATNTKTLWQGYEDDIVKLYPVLQDMTRRGFPINLEERETFRVSCLTKAAEVLEELQDVYPMELRRPDPQLGYKNVPKEVGELADKFEQEFCNIDSLHYTVFFNQATKDLTFAKYLESNTRRDNDKTKKDVAGQTGLIVKEFKLENGLRVKRYCRLDRFKPNSTPQRIAYIKYKGYKIKVKRKGKEQSETTDKNAMYDLYEETNDSFFLKVGMYTELIKFVSTYIKGWPTDNEGRVHAIFLPLPASGQWSCSPNIQNCFSGDTEVLTTEGWKRFFDLDENEIVAQYDINNKDIDFVKPLNFIKGYNQSLLHIKTNDQIDLLVTPEHDCLLQQRRTNEFIKIKAVDYREDYLQHQAGNFIGGNLEFTNSQLCLIAALQADGHITEDNALDWKIKKQRKIIRLRKALNNLGLLFKESDNIGGYKRFYVSSKTNDINWLLDKKKFSSWILQLTKNCFRFLAKEVWFWDGCYNRQSMYSSSIKSNADWVQILTCLTNRRAKIREYQNLTSNSNINYQVDASNRNYSMTTNRTIKEYKNGYKVFCVTMPKGTVIVRRNGLVSITGNSPGHGTRYNSAEYVGLAKQFRNSVQPKAGHTFVELDYTGFHAGMLGFEADDYASLNNGGESAFDYIRLSRLGIHDFLAAHMVRNEYMNKKRIVQLGNINNIKIDKLREETLEVTKDLDKWLDYDDSILATKLSWIKKNHEHVRNSQAKPAVHGVGFGMGIHKFYKLNKHAFASLEEPRRILLLLRKLFPDVFIWQDYIKELAHNQTYLMSRYGYIRYFWDVYDFRLLPTFRAPKSEYEKIFVTKDGKVWSRADGQQVKEAIAYFPSNNAFGKKKEAIRELEEYDYLNKWRWVLDNHDSLLFECPNEFVDECVVEGSKIMAAPARHLISKRFPDGISSLIGAKIGASWGTMKGYEV